MIKFSYYYQNLLKVLQFHPTLLTGECYKSLLLIDSQTISNILELCYVCMHMDRPEQNYVTYHSNRIMIYLSKQKKGYFSTTFSI